MTSSTALTRRDWLQKTTAAGLAVATAGLTAIKAHAQVDTQKLPSIDAHSHVWSPDTERWPLARKQTKLDLRPASFTPEELFKLADPVGVGRVVLIQHSVYHEWDNRYLLDCIRQYPGRFSLVGMIDDRQPRPGERLKELLPQGVRGLRITPRMHGETWLEGPGMESLWKTAAETGQNMCCLVDPSHLPQVAGMCRRHPGTPVVLDHFARVGASGTIRESDIAALCDLAKHKRVTVKLSAYYALGQKQPPYEDLLPLIRRVLDAFTPERCMWASDAPYQVQPPHTYVGSIGLIRDHLSGLSAGDKQQLLAATAERVFFA